MKKEYNIKITTVKNLENICGNQDLAAMLSNFDGRIYHVVEEGGQRFIDGNTMASGNSLETDITNMILLIVDHHSIAYDQKPYFKVDIIEKK